MTKSAHEPSVVNRMGFGSRHPTPVAVGRNAYVRWWERLRAAISLSIIVIGLGLVLAVLIGALVFLLGYGLEQIVSG